MSYVHVVLNHMFLKLLNKITILWKRGCLSMSLYNELDRKEQELIDIANELNDMRKDTVSIIDDRLTALIDTVDSIINMDEPDDIITELHGMLDELKSIKEDLY